MSYTQYGVTLSQEQIEKLAKAAHNKSSTKIRLKNVSLTGNNYLPLTKRQIAKIEKLKLAEKGIDLNLSTKQILHIVKIGREAHNLKRGGFLSQHGKKIGGFLPFIPVIIAGLAAAAGATQIVKTVNEKNAASAKQAEDERHNREMESVAKSQVIQQKSEATTGAGIKNKKWKCDVCNCVINEANKINHLKSKKHLKNGGYLGAMHLTGHNFTGPGTRLDKRLDPKTDEPYEWSKPINRVDKSSLHHDKCYRDNPSLKGRHKCDDIMIDELDSIENPTTRECIERSVVKPIIKTKKWLGFGSKQKQTSKNLKSGPMKRK